MPLRPQPLAIQFVGGVETKQDSKQVPTTKLLNLENATFIKATTLAKRNGYRALSRLIDGDAAEIEDPIGLGARGDELLLFTAERCYSYRPSVDRWVDTGEIASVTASERPIARTGTTQTVHDHATNRGVTVLAWEDSRGGVYASVVEADTGRILLAETALDADGQSPRCVPCGTVLHVYWTRPSTSRIYVAIVNPAMPTAIPSPSILTSDLDASNPAYDATSAAPVDSDGHPALMAWSRNGGGFRVAYVHPSGVIGSPVTGLPSAATFTDTSSGPIAVAIDRTAGHSIAVLWTDAGTVSLRFIDPIALSSTLGSDYTEPAVATDAVRASLEYGALTDALSTAWWAVERLGADPDTNSIVAGGVTDGGVEIQAPRVLRGHGLVSRAFVDDGHVYALVGHEVEYSPYVACVRLSGSAFGEDEGTACYYRSIVGQFIGHSARKHVTSAHPVDPDANGVGRTHTATIGYRIQLDSEDGDQWSEAGIKFVSMDFDADNAYQSAELGRGLYLAGACPSHYDGRRWAESGFHTAPDVADGVTVAVEGTGGLLAAGTYGYKLCYEEIDALGEWHPGPVSIQFNVTIGALKKVDITAPTYRLTSKSHVRLGVFRSPVNQTGDPQAIPFYRVSSIDPEETGDNGFILNDPTVDTISFTDNIADAELLTREPLYTNGGILSNDPSPMAGGVIAGGKSRLFWTDIENPHAIRYSQEIVEDTGLEAPIALYAQCDPYGGSIVAIGVMDGAIYGFAETGIYGFGGPGPNRNPAAGPEAFSPPELITGDVGCKAPNSICQSPVGIVFQSEKGIRLLGRDRAVQDIGAPVYAYNEQTITRATLLPDRSQIVFLTDSGRTLLWDYERNQWSTFTNHEGIDARVIGGRYYYLRNDGRVFAETLGEYRDDNVRITMRIETAWIHFAPYLQGWQRVLWAYFLGTYKSAHTLHIRYRVNYDDDYRGPINLDVNTNYDPSLYGAGVYGAGPYGGTGGGVSRYQRRIHLNKECQAIQFRIEDSEATGDAGASFELSELLLIGGILDSAYKPGPARTQ
jgi:hypothetical protein